MARRDCLSNCPKAVFCDYAAMVCEQKAARIHEDTQKTREALGGLSGILRDHRHETDAVDNEIREVTEEELLAGAYKAMLVTSAATQYREERNATLAACDSGPVVRDYGVIACRSSSLGLGSYTTVNLMHDVSEMTDG